MSANIHGLFWFPNLPDKFVLWGQEITLYEVRNRTDRQAEPVKCKCAFSIIEFTLICLY